MDQKNNNHFLDGLFWGAVLGGTAVFLLGTKRGREISKMLREEGMHKAAKIEDLFASYQDDLEENEESSSSAKITEDKPRKRFFKGLPKRK